MRFSKMFPPALIVAQHREAKRYTECRMWPFLSIAGSNNLKIWQLQMFLPIQTPHNNAAYIEAIMVQRERGTAEIVYSYKIIAPIISTL